MKKSEFIKQACYFIDNNLKLHLVKLMMDNRTFEIKSSDTRNLRDCKEFMDANFNIKNINKIWDFIKGNNKYKIDNF